MRKVSVFVIAIFLACPTFGANESREQRRLAACGQVFKEILDIPDGIPKDLLNKAECVIVIPSVLKFAIGIGGDFGRGAITCRTGQHFTGHWSAPALFALEGANIGLQLGGQATDFVLLVMNPKGANSILSSKVKLGADASAAIGPKGRAAAADTDIVMRAEVLSYSRSRGLFAGISLEVSTLRSDGSANKKLYGRSLSAKEIVREGKVGVSASGRGLISLLDKRSPKNESDPVSLKEQPAAQGAQYRFRIRLSRCVHSSYVVYARKSGICPVRKQILRERRDSGFAGEVGLEFRWFSAEKNRVWTRRTVPWKDVFGIMWGDFPLSTILAMCSAISIATCFTFFPGNEFGFLHDAFEKLVVEDWKG